MPVTCCIKSCTPFIIGCITPCDSLRINYAVTGGEYTLLTEFAGRVQRVTQTFETGDTLAFDLTGFNEGYTFKAIILRPDGEQMTFSRDGVCYDGFIFKTNIGVDYQIEPLMFLPC